MLCRSGWMTRTKTHRVYFIVFVILLLSACAGSRVVQPLNKSQWQASLSFGGPLLTNKDQQTEITPMSSISGAYGFTQAITGFSSWQIGSLQNEIYHFDAGFTHELIPPFSIRPGITYSGIANLLSESGSWKTRLYPQVDINAYWLLPNKDFFYTGMSNWFEFSSKKAHSQTQEHHWLTSFHIGYTKTIKQYSANLEAKYLAPFNQSEEQLIDFVNLGNRGAIGLYFSVSRKF